MTQGHKIERKIEVKTFLDIIDNIKEENIIKTKHSFFRLSDSQKKEFENVIKDYIKRETPLMVGIQNNKCYAVFYDYTKAKALKIILDIYGVRCEIVTIYIIDKDDILRI